VEVSAPCSCASRLANCNIVGKIFGDDAAVILKHGDRYRDGRVVATNARGSAGLRGGG